MHHLQNRAGIPALWASSRIYKQQHTWDTNAKYLESYPREMWVHVSHAFHIDLDTWMCRLIPPPHRTNIPDRGDFHHRVLFSVELFARRRLKFSSSEILGHLCNGNSFCRGPGVLPDFIKNAETCIGIDFWEMISLYVVIVVVSLPFTSLYGAWHIKVAWEIRGYCIRQIH